MARKIVWRTFALVALFVGVVGSGFAQDAATTPFDGRALFNGIVASIIYSVLGIIILMVGFKVFDWTTPFDLNKEIADDDNVAAGVAVAGIMIGLGLIVAAAIG